GLQRHTPRIKEMGSLGRWLIAASSRKGTPRDGHSGTRFAGQDKTQHLRSVPLHLDDSAPVSSAPNARGRLLTTATTPAGLSGARGGVRWVAMMPPRRLSRKGVS